HDLAGKGDHAQKQCRLGKVIHQPCRGKPGHPVADERRALANKEQLEVAMAQGAPGVRERGLRRYGRRGRHQSSTRRLTISAAGNGFAWSSLWSWGMAWQSHVSLAF